MVPRSLPIRTAAVVGIAIIMVVPGLTSVLPGTAWGETAGPTRQSGPPPPNSLVVVAPMDWRSALQPLLDWRARTTGLSVVFLAIEGALSSGHGRDAPARLKDAITNASTSVATAEAGGLDTLLLVGDGSVIPVRRVFIDFTGDGNLSDPLNYRWTDDYYALGTERTWDRDGDGVYGEDGEVLKEVADAYQDPHAPKVGRIPAANLAQVGAFVTKLLAYERDPPAGDWYGRALLASGLMDVPNVLDNPFTPDWDGGYNAWSDNAYESHKILDRMLEPRYNVTWLADYPFFEGGHWNLTVDTLDHTSLVRAFDGGNAIVSMNAHGWTDGTGIAHYNGSGYTDYWFDWSTAYDYVDAQRAGNGGRLPFVYIAACYVGDISLPSDRTLAQLVLDPGGGAIGMVAGNGENYKGESQTNASFGNWFLERDFWANYFGSVPGDALLRTKHDYLELVRSAKVPHDQVDDVYYVADYLSYNLLGDPLTNVWTAPPRHMGIQGVSDTDTAGTPSIAVSVTGADGGPVQGARVSVQWDGNRSANGITGPDGRAEIEIPVGAGTLDILVTAQGFQPVQIAIERPVTGPDMDITALSLEGRNGREPPFVQGDTITLTASVAEHGPYEYDNAPVQFLVAREGGAFEALLPPVYVALWGHGTRLDVVHDWTPSEPGRWRVRVIVDPAQVFPDSDRTNNVREVGVLVWGPPQWVGLPSDITLDCRNAPGGSIDLKPFLRDPETSADKLAVEARASGTEGGGSVELSVAAGNVLWAWPSVQAGRSFTLSLTASDGLSSAEASTIVHVLRSPPSLWLVVPGPIRARVGENVTGTVVVEGLPDWHVYGVGLTAVDSPSGFRIDPATGAFRFMPVDLGDQFATVEAVFTDAAGCKTVVATTLLEFIVSPAQGSAPVPVEWQALETAAGEVARVQLAASVADGGHVNYALASKGGLDASIDPMTGILTVRPGRSEKGAHTVEVLLSSGNASATYPLEVTVTQAPPAGGTGYGPYLASGAVAFLAAAVIWRGRRRTTRPKP